MKIQSFTTVLLLLATAFSSLSAQASDGNADLSKSTQDAIKVDDIKSSQQNNSSVAVIIHLAVKDQNNSSVSVKQNDNQTVSLNGEVPSQNQNSQSDQLPTQSQQSAEASATNSQPDQALPESSQSGDISSQSKQSDKPTDPNQQSGQVPSQNQQSGPASSPSDIAPAQNLPSDQVHVVNQTSGQTSTPSHPSDKVPSSDHQSVQNASTNQNDVKSANLTNESKILPDQPPSPVNNTPVLNDTSEPPNLPVVKHDKSLDTICDICKCSDSILSNPYYINCTKSLLDHKIPPWGKLFDTEFTEVDNVHLLLSLNGFVTVPVITKAMPIDAIDFSQNDISVIEPFAFGGLPHLKRLSLSRNSLNNLDGNVFGVKNETFLSLEILDLSYNVITHLPNDIFEKTRYLQELNLEGNPFQVLDSSTIAALNSLTALQILNLANMELKELPMGLINPVQHLYGLNLADNNFVRIPEVIQHGRNLEHLVLSGNLMTEFGAHSFIELNNLKVIEINNLEHLKAIHKGTFFPFKSLTNLECHHNPQLSHIEIRAFNDENNDGLQKIEMLELQYNNLTSLDSALFKHVEIIDLNLGGNPWNCSCELYWIKSDAATYDYLKDIRCNEPASLKGKTFEEINFESEEVPCPPGWHNPDHRSFSDITYVVTETYSFWIFVLLVGLLILIAVTVIIFRTKPQWQYKIMKIVIPQKAEYRNDKASTNVRYMRQFDDDQGFSEDVITEYCAQRDRHTDDGV